MSEQGIIRVALRVEGDMLVAYLADDGPTDGSRVLGSIARRFVRNDDIARAFLELMQDSLIAVMPGTSGVTFEEWDEKKAEQS